MRKATNLFGLALCLICGSLQHGTASEADDYKIDRKDVFEFTRKPVCTRTGDTVSIEFTSKDFCDAGVVIEREDGEILRHLAYGVLGSNAPAPFKPNSLAQSLTWDGKDNNGQYVDDLSKVRVRVSLGLKPQFEKTLFWHPKKLVARRRHPRCVAQPEGVYVYEGGGVESIKLFSHEGKYIRTVYPFPADKVKSVKGLGWSKFADGHTAPKHVGYWNSTYLSSGTGVTHATWGTAARTFAIHQGRVALVPWHDSSAIQKGADNRLMRLHTDGTSGGLQLQGGPIDTPLPAHSAAFSPDGKVLYLAGCYKNAQKQFAAMPPRVVWHHGVYRMAYDSNEPPKLWLGGNPGKDEKHFNHPSSVRVDAKGRVYIADNHNDRVQIFSPDGNLLKSIQVKGPALLRIHHRTQELYVFSWTMSMGHSAAGGKPYKVPAVLRVYDPFKSPKPSLQVPIPLYNYREAMITSDSSYTDEMPYRVELDSYTEPPTLWMVTGSLAHRGKVSMANENIQRFQIKKGKFVLLDTWNKEVAGAIRKWEPPNIFRQRLHVDPRNGMLYSMEGKTTHQLVRINPDSGKVDLIELPYSAEDMAIDNEGHIYLRCDRIIGRFHLDTMREVPFDYGEERFVKWDSFSKGGSVVAGLVLPGNRPGYWFESGMGVNPKGEIIVSTCNKSPKTQRMRGVHGLPKAIDGSGTKYTPGIFPGRARYAEIHIFDKHGQPVGMDIAAQGVGAGHGTLVDPNGDVYFLNTRNRIYNGKAFYPLTGCVLKFKRGKGRFIASRNATIPISPELKPTFPQQLNGYWVKDADWIYPGAGFCRNAAPCFCWNTRFAVDYFGRSFIPEYIRNQVAVLDTNGNLILHVGKYGNVDDGVPLVSDQKLRAQKPRSIGGDEVSLMYANYVTSHSDRRLFIADAGNGRIISVKLGYYAEEMVSLGRK